MQKFKCIDDPTDIIQGAQYLNGDFKSLYSIPFPIIERWKPGKDQNGPFVQVINYDGTECILRNTDWACTRDGLNFFLKSEDAVDNLYQRENFWQQIEPGKKIDYSNSNVKPKVTKVVDTDGRTICFATNDAALAVIAEETWNNLPEDQRETIVGKPIS